MLAVNALISLSEVKVFSSQSFSSDTLQGNRQNKAELKPN